MKTNQKCHVIHYGNTHPDRNMDTRNIIINLHSHIGTHISNTNLIDRFQTEICICLEAAVFAPDKLNFFANSVRKNTNTSYIIPNN